MYLLWLDNLLNTHLDDNTLSQPGHDTYVEMSEGCPISQASIALVALTIPLRVS